jgi:large subunit ribosomal protein L21
MYAVIKTGGKQYRVNQGDKLKIEKIAGDVGANVVLDQILTVVDGDNVTI